MPIHRSLSSRDARAAPFPYVRGCNHNRDLVPVLSSLLDFSVLPGRHLLHCSLGLACLTDAQLLHKARSDAKFYLVCREIDLSRSRSLRSHPRSNA